VIVGPGNRDGWSIADPAGFCETPGPPDDGFTRGSYRQKLHAVRRDLKEAGSGSRALYNVMVALHHAPMNLFTMV